jgi:hypothetical protein
LAKQLAAEERAKEATAHEQQALKELKAAQDVADLLQKQVVAVRAEVGQAKDDAAAQGKKVSAQREEAEEKAQQASQRYEKLLREPVTVRTKPLL